MHNFRELNVWQKSRNLNKDVYEMSENFPQREQYGIISQIRRSSVSISSNIAEGSARQTTKDFIRFLRIALGSAFELETQLILSTDLGFVDEEKINPIIDQIIEIQKMIIGLERRLAKEGS